MKTEEVKDVCPLCGGKVNVDTDGRCQECGEVIDKPVAEDDEDVVQSIRA